MIKNIKYKEYIENLVKTSLNKDIVFNDNLCISSRNNNLKSKFQKYVNQKEQNSDNFSLSKSIRQINSAKKRHRVYRDKNLLFINNNNLMRAISAKIKNPIISKSTKQKDNSSAKSIKLYDKNLDKNKTLKLSDIIKKNNNLKGNIRGKSNFSNFKKKNSDVIKQIFKSKKMGEKMEQINNENNNNNKNEKELSSSFNSFNEYDKEKENNILYLNLKNITSCAKIINVNNINKENTKKCNIF